VKERRWKLVALLAAGMAVGVVMVGTPAGAHIGSVTHLWNKHIKPKADKRYQRIPTSTQHYAIAGSALVPNDGSRGDTFVPGTGDEDPGWCYTGGEFYAEIHLPHGAKLTGLTVDYDDDSGTVGSNGSVFVTRMAFRGRGGTYEDIFFASLPNTGTPGDTATANATLQNAGAQVVNNFRHVYNIIGQFVSAGTAICGIDVKYTVKAPFAAARVSPGGASVSSRP
jgi:hypothetical protein